MGLRGGWGRRNWRVQGGLWTGLVGKGKACLVDSESSETTTSEEEEVAAADSETSQEEKVAVAAAPAAVMVSMKV